MSADKLIYYYNVPRKGLCDQDANLIASSSMFPSITLSQEMLLCLYCLDDEGNPWAFNATDVFSWAADTDWDDETPVKMRTDNDGINSGLWDEEDPTTGKISILMDANTEGVQTVLGTSEKKPITGELQVRRAGEENPYYLGYMKFWLHNLIDHQGVDPDPLEEPNYSKAEIDAFIAACVKIASYASDFSVLVATMALDPQEIILEEGTVLGRLPSEGPIATFPSAINEASLQSWLQYANEDGDILEVDLPIVNWTPDFNLTGGLATANDQLAAILAGLDEKIGDIVALLGSSELGLGDMIKMIYDTNDDGVVDAADEAGHALFAGGLVNGDSEETNLSMGEVLDGEFLKRDGNSIVGSAESGLGDMLKSVYDTNDDGVVDAADFTYGLVNGDSGETELSIGEVEDGEFLKRDGNSLIGASPLLPNLIPLPIRFPNAWMNLSGLTGLWTVSGSGSNEYYFVRRVSDPLQVLYDGSAATEGTLGSLADHEWGYGDNDSLGYSTIYVRDDSSDPDSLDFGLWQADFWNMESATFDPNSEGGSGLLMDDTEDQGMVLELPPVPSWASTLVIEARVRAEDTITTGALTFAAKLRWTGDGEAFAQAVAATLAEDGVTLTGAGQFDLLRIELDLSTNSLAAGDWPLLCLYRDVSEDSVGESVQIRHIQGGYE